MRISQYVIHSRDNFRISKSYVMSPQQNHSSHTKIQIKINMAQNSMEDESFDLELEEDTI